MSKNDDVEAGHQHHYPPPPHKGTFQVVSGNPPPPAGDQSAPQYPHGYQPYPPGMPVREVPPLPCGIGFGWILFILGFFCGVIPWYVGVIIFLCSKIDPRERPGLIACIVAAVIATILIIIILATHHWDYHQ